MNADRAKHEFDDLNGKAVDDVKDAFTESDEERLEREAREVRRS